MHKKENKLCNVLNSNNVLWWSYVTFLWEKMTGSPGQTRPLMWINMTSSWEKICKLIFFQIPVCIWWHWVSRGLYFLVLGGTGSVLGGTDWYLIVLGRYRAELVVTWWYWVSRGLYWLVLGGTGSEQGGTGCQHDMLPENIWFAWSRSSNHWIFEEGKSDYGHTDRQNFLM